MASINEKIKQGRDADKSKSDNWFAWYPVRLGALGTGGWLWLEKVWRNKCCGVTIYQPIDEYVYAGYELHPRLDITVYELASIFAITTMRKEDQEHEIELLPDSYKRHLVRIEINKRTGAVTRYNYFHEELYSHYTPLE